MAASSATFPLVCAICRNGFSETCIECEADGKNKSRCPLNSGKCHHKYHDHCIQRWLKTRSGCPLCAENWEGTLEGDEEPTEQYDMFGTKEED